MTKEKPWTRKSTSPFLSRQRVGDNLRKLGRSVACLASNPYERKESADEGKPKLHYSHSEPLPRPVPLGSLKRTARDVGVQQDALLPPKTPDLTKEEVIALSEAHRGLVNARRRLVQDQVKMQSEMSNVESALRFIGESQDQFLNIFARSISSEEPVSELKRIHEQLQDDCDAFRSYHEAWRQAEMDYYETTAEVQQHDRTFISHVKGYVSKQPELPHVPANLGLRDGDRGKQRNSGVRSQLLDDFHDQRGKVLMLEERASELEADYQQELTSRDFFEDQGHVQEQSREDFILEYSTALDRTRRELDEARAHLARLERKCRDEKLDMSEIRRESSDGGRIVQTSSPRVLSPAGKHSPAFTAIPPHWNSVSTDPTIESTFTVVNDPELSVSQSNEKTTTSTTQIDRWVENIPSQLGSEQHSTRADDESPPTTGSMTKRHSDRED